jgi:hypothetical protein
MDELRDDRRRDDMSDSGKFNISIGSVSQSQIVTGDYATVSQRVGLSPEEVERLAAAFAGMRATVESEAPPEKRDEALAQAAALERAVVAEEPDPGRVRRALRWFRDNLPELAGAVTSVMVNPLVGQVVANAGEAVAAQFRDAVEEGKPEG